MVGQSGARRWGGCAESGRAGESDARGADARRDPGPARRPLCAGGSRAEHEPACASAAMVHPARVFTVHWYLFSNHWGVPVMARQGFRCSTGVVARTAACQCAHAQGSLGRGLP